MKKLYNKTFGYLFYSVCDRYGNYFGDLSEYTTATAYVTMTKFLILFIFFPIIGKPAFEFLKTEIGVVSIVIIMLLLYWITYIINKENILLQKKRIYTIILLLIPISLFFISLILI